MLLLLLAAQTVVVGPAAASSADREARHRTVTYEVVAEGEVAARLDDVARQVGDILVDDRGWSLGGSLRFVEVEDDAELSVVLAEPAVIDAAAEGCSAEFSCRLGSQVLLNDDRWLRATPEWLASGGTVAAYRAYVVNHEVGHFLGFGHFECEEAGQPAPVMKQQSKGPGECEPNGWPVELERQDLGQRFDLPVRPVDDGPHDPEGDEDDGLADAAAEDGVADDDPSAEDGDTDAVAALSEATARLRFRMARAQVADAIAWLVGQEPDAPSVATDLRLREVPTPRIVLLTEPLAGLGREAG